MKSLCILSTLLKSKRFLKSLPIVRVTPSINVSFKSFLVSRHLVSKDINTNSKYLHTDSDNEELYEHFSVEENEMESNKNARDIVFKNYQDDIITELNSCVSIEEVLNLVLKYKNIYEDRHALQTILVLIDLQSIYFQFNGFSKTASRIFLENLRNNEGFCSLLQCIKNKLDDFDSDYISYVLFYLNKLGIPVEDKFMQNAALQVRNNLLKNFYLDQCSRFLTVIFSENSVRPYYLSLSIVPLVINRIENCNSVSNLHNLTICLNKFHKMLTVDLLEKYKAKVTEFLDNKQLTGTDYSTLLKILMLLNYPEWRDKNIFLISNCILTMKDEINLLNIEDLTILYEIFFKNQEPGIILNSIQRCSAKFLLQLDEEEENGVSGSNITRLKLFSSLIYFSSPLHRIQFRNQMPKYLNICQTYRELNQLRKIFSYVKISNSKLCASYWNLSLKILNENVDANVILQFCQNYMYFHTDVNNYRYYEFESRIIEHIKENLTKDPLLNPEKISGYLSFALLYAQQNDKDILNVLLNKFEENLNRIKPSDCLKLSHSLSILNNRRIPCLFAEQTETIKILLNKYTKNVLELGECSYLENSVLLKALVFRNDTDNEIVEHLFEKYRELDVMSSKMIENICYISMATQGLIPELLDKCTEYVIKHKDSILGFNAEKLLFLCYSLAYHPVNGDTFFEVVTDVIIRDQERLSGLAFLQSTISLCYFNKLPRSFVKQIFNVEFLEKLDMELENCYSKDKYPQRVRNALMMLNRVVCLEYPEFNVPWFHKKYLEDIKKSLIKKTDNTFQERVKEYLIQMLGTRQYISEHVISPYGYHINFVVNFNSREEVVPSDSPDVKRRVALLLLRQHAFTRFCTQLRGKYQLQKRHLEILGYEVATINFNDWVGLFYGEERLGYISKLIFPSGKKNIHDVIR